MPWGTQERGCYFMVQHWALVGVFPGASGSAGQCFTPFSLFQPPITTSTSSSSFSQVSVFASLSCNVGC